MQATVSTAGRRVRKGAFATLACLAVAGCDDAPVPLADARQAAPEASRWRDVSETTPPERWLAGLDSGDPAHPPAQSVERFGSLLAEASSAYIETPRMVANRLVQAKDTIEATPALADSSDTTLEDLFRRLIFKARDGERLLFGTVVHHYLNLRRQGLDEEAAAERVALEFGAERLADVR